MRIRYQGSSRPLKLTSEAPRGFQSLLAKMKEYGKTRRHLSKDHEEFYQQVDKELEYLWKKLNSEE